MNSASSCLMCLIPTPHTAKLRSPVTARDASHAPYASHPPAWVSVRNALNRLFIDYFPRSKRHEAYGAYEALLIKQLLMKKTDEALDEALKKQSEAPALDIDALPDIAVSQADFARRVGVSRQSIGKAVKEGRLQLNGRRRLDLKPSLKRWEETKAHTRPDRETAAPAPAAEDAEFEGEITDTDSRAFWRGEILKAETTALEIELDLRKRSRYQVGDTEKHLSEIGGAIRGGVERLIDQLAPRLLAVNPADRHELMQREIQRLKTEVKNQFKRAQRQLDEQ